MAEGGQLEENFAERRTFLLPPEGICFLSSGMAAVLVNLELVATDATDAIRQLASSTAQMSGVVDSTKLLSDVLAREAVLSTYLGEGVALPHARTESVTQRVVAIGRSLAGVPFGPKGEVAQLIVLIGCPRQEINAYLTFSKLLMRRLRMEKVRAELLTTQDRVRFLQLLELDDKAPASTTTTP